MRKKILVILGTRPEIIRLSVIMKKIKKYFNLCVVNTGQNFNKKLNENFFKELHLSSPKYSLKCNNDSPIKFVSDLLPKVDEILKIEKPEAVLILGDTNSGLSALCAKRKKIPIFHLEAGNRCFDNRVPEEINRKLIDGLADINLTYSEVAKQNLIKENFDLDRIIKVGSPLAEVFEHYQQEIENSQVLLKLKIRKNNYFLVSCHREENVDCNKNLKTIFSTLNELAIKYKVKIIVSTHPRTKIRLKANKIKFSKNIIFLNPLSFFDYVKMQKNAKLTISDSGSITEESNILKFAAVNLRNTTERQEGFEQGSVIMSGIQQESIIQSVENALFKNNNLGIETHLDYKDKNTSDKIITIMQSYIHYINSKMR